MSRAKGRWKIEQHFGGWSWLVVVVHFCSTEFLPRAEFSKLTVLVMGGGGSPPLPLT